MTRTVFFYGVILALGALALQWLEYQYFVRAFSAELYIALIAAGFTALGAWVGARLTRAPAGAAFEKNEAAIRSLGVTPREYQVLGEIAAGKTNKEIARALDVSPNTVKTHLASLYEKLGAARRTEAVRKARDLSLIP